MEGPCRRLAVLESPQGGKVVSQEPGRVLCSPQPSHRGKEGSRCFFWNSLALSVIQQMLAI